MMFDERSIEWFVLVSLDDQFDDLIRERDEVVFCAWVEGEQTVEIFVRSSCEAQGGLSANLVCVMFDTSCGSET